MSGYPRKQSLTSRLASVLRSKKFKDENARIETVSPPVLPRYVGRGIQNSATFRPADNNTNEQTGERCDNTALLHGLAHFDPNESLESLENAPQQQMEPWRPSGEHDIALLPAALWSLIASYLSPCDVVCLSLSKKIILRRLGRKCWLALEGPENHEEKVKFLLTMDEQLPNHLLCFPCAVYHRRMKIGEEHLKSAMVLNPLYICGSVGKPGHKPPKTRLTPGYMLPFSFIQLVTRAHKFSANHGIPVNDLSRRYKDRDSQWSHQTRYYMHRGHLLLRVTSHTFAAAELPPSGQRHLLYSREDYTPYFSCCAHWRDGELMKICKCALSHISAAHQPVGQQLRKVSFAQRPSNSNSTATLCSFCRPMRRCPECPTEYLVELKLSEDRNDPVARFKQSIVVTRWSDLGDGTSPYSLEWAAVNGNAQYDSFENIGKRAISGTFEAQSGVALPGQRLISLNPKMQKVDEDDNGWY